MNLEDLKKATPDPGRGSSRKKAPEGGLDEIEERSRQFLEATRVIPWEADATTWRFAYVGLQAVKLLGYPQEEWYGENFWTAHLHPEDREHSLRAALRLLGLSPTRYHNWKREENCELDDASSCPRSFPIS